MWKMLIFLSAYVPIGAADPVGALIEIIGTVGSICSILSFIGGRGDIHDRR